MKNLLTEKCVSSHWLNFHQKGIKWRMERKVDSRSSRDGAVKKPYSPKMMSKKKSSAFSGIWSETPRARHPVQYHPSYAWTRRGRLRELRIRFYYERRILQKVFEEWKEEWWVSHREWKLRVRADCHYRYYLYNLMFQTWKTYVHQQQEMRNRYLRAEDHDARQKMRQAWKSWLIYVVFRRTKLRLQTTALEFRQRSILWVWWSMWRRQLGQVHLGRALHASAVKHRARSLQLQAWSRWQEQLLHVWKERQKMVSAVKHHQHWQQWRALRAWLEYLQVRREKRQRKETAEGFHCVIVLQTHFCDWRWAWKRRESLYIHHERVERLARMMVLRRAFIHWKHYVLLCAETAVRRKVAEEHHRRGLLLLHRFWNLWQSQLEQREESEQLPFLCAAWDHYRITLLRKCFKLWLQYTQKRRSQQLLQARADSHFQRRALPGAFQAWRRLWQWHQQERVLYARAARFHRVMLEKQLFALWCQKISQHREHRLAERMAILHAERQFLRRSWSTWCQQAVAHRLEWQRQAVACAHHRLRWLRKAFCVWRESARGLRTERTGRARAARFHAAQLLCWAWSRWREHLALHSAEQQKLMRADLHCQRTLLYRALQTWGVYQSRVRSVLQEVAARESWHERRLLRSALRRWRENAVAQADEAKKASRAAAHYRRTLCSKVLIAWREAVSVQIYYRQQEGQAVRDAQVALNRGCLRTWFRRWRDRSWSAAQQRVQMERVAQHYRRQLLLQAMARWKVHHLSCIRKRLLQRQAARLLAQTLSRTCFHQWRQQLADRRREQQDTARALWFWAFSLQAKVWAAWLGFVLEMRRKKVRQERAVQAYHQQLLREGVMRLLCFAAGMKAFRQQLHTQQQVQAAHSLHRVVRRCAMLWKQKALGLGREPQPPTSTVCSRRVTFEGPLPSHLAAGAGDASPETKRITAPRGLRGALDSLASATGDTQLLELNAARWARKQPRRPSFLLEPIESQTPLGPEALWEHGLGEVQPIGLALTTPFLAKAQTALDPSSPLPSASGLKPPPTVSTGLELLPPSSFMLRGAEAHTWASAQPTIPGLKSQAPSSLASVPNPRLLLPGDFTGTRPGPGSDTAAYSPIATGHMDLEAELEGIQQQLQDYQTTKHNLRSCQRQASSLRQWLELSQEEPRPEDQEAEQQVQEELQEVEAQIQQLASKLQAQRQPIRTCIARIHALRQALC
ncbi:PREDICTED: protein SFI1 homolog isoform X3 [Lipotes vexillifer]|uniref:Protein SFI1 homolog isoform X3 n=1 Tax=Lipotes vexillifer TaxID=118797 RepID=A0A340X1Q7_LIPVE|nr:PREDICTED: protein SFI1 homolog isoform X3 [Lipotes vexillifer]